MIATRPMTVRSCSSVLVEIGLPTRLAPGGYHLPGYDLAFDLAEAAGDGCGVPGCYELPIACASARGGAGGERSDAGNPSRLARAVMLAACQRLGYDHRDLWARDTFGQLCRRRDLPKMRQRVWVEMRAWRPPAGIGRLQYLDIARACGLSSHSTVCLAVARAERIGITRERWSMDGAEHGLPFDAQVALVEAAARWSNA
jgi:hypothetical protein